MSPRRQASDPALHAVGPDAAVLKALRTFGAKEVEITGAPSWWIIPGHDQAMTWREAVIWMAACATATRTKEKPPHKTPEFWFATAAFFGISGTFLTALVDTGFGGPLAPFLMPVAGFLAAVVPIGYRFATVRAHRLTEQERVERHDQFKAETVSTEAHSGPAGRREPGP